MRKIILSLMILVLLASTIGASYDNKSFEIPKSAKKISENAYDLGKVKVKGEELQGYLFVHKKDAAVRQSGSAKLTPCYGFLAKGARWKTTEPYVLDTSNAEGMNESFVADNIQTGLNIWDSQVAFPIFGARDTLNVVDGADASSPDDKNEILLGSIADSGTIAVTIVWGIFGGPTASRKLVEYDLVFDQADFSWGDALSNPSLMDFQNIAVHELGHAAGMDDLYTSSCSEQTMYGYATEGETKKRDLNSGDITGIKNLYR